MAAYESLHVRGWGISSVVLVVYQTFDLDLDLDLEHILDVRLTWRPSCATLIAIQSFACEK